jgi:hypothetical protein
MNVTHRTRRAAVTLIVGCMCLLVAGCYSNGPSKAKVENNGSVSIESMGGSGTVDLVTMRDGTKCAVLIGYYKGAIHCDWRGN